MIPLPPRLSAVTSAWLAGSRQPMMARRILARAGPGSALKPAAWAHQTAALDHPDCPLLPVASRTDDSAKISLLDLFGLAEFAWLAFCDHPALGQNISVVGDGECLTDVLLHQKDGDAAL